VLVVHDHALLTRGVEVTLARRGWLVELADGASSGEVLIQARATRPDVVLLDVDHGDGIGGGIELIEPLVALGSHVVMLAEEARRLCLAECLAAGADGWINTTLGLDEIDSALRTVAAGRPLIRRAERSELLQWLVAERSNRRPPADRLGDLNAREAAVLAALVDGSTAEDIARRRVEALTSVRTEIRTVLHKLGVRSQCAAVALAAAHRDLLPVTVDALPRPRSVPTVPGPVLPRHPMARSA
jgi:DNA-binding NarL/FixJ family response regulator